MQPQPPFAGGSVGVPEFFRADERNKTFHHRLASARALVDKRARRAVFIADEEIEQPLDIKFRQLLRRVDG